MYQPPEHPPQYPPGYPQGLLGYPPPPRRPRNDHLSWIIAGSIGGAVLLILICVCLALFLFAPLSSHRTGGPNTSQQPVVTSTQAATASASTPANGPASPVTGARLGGPQEDFTATFGQPGSQLGPGTYSAVVNGYHVYIGVAFDTGQDGAQRVPEMRVQPQAGTWSVSAGEGVMRALMPLDSQHVSDGPSDSYGTHHVYRSEALAASFDSSAFQDSNLNPVTPGTFDFACQRDVCYMGTGTGAF
jgi:hypothetical protein